MARRLNCGEICCYQFAAPDKCHPMPILTRQEVIGLLHTVIVAPITSSVRGAPSEVVIGIDEGPKQNQQLNLIMCKP